jgi:ribulose-5-phosphate 4-epimerase/fuculose-1-phosphate aldolase
MRRASKNIALHRKIDDASATTASPARCVIHAHSTHMAACSLQADTEAGGQLAPDTQLPPPITPYFVMKVGRVPHIPYHRPGASAAADAVAKTIARYAAQGSPVRAVMLARLGANVWHDTPPPPPSPSPSPSPSLSLSPSPSLSLCWRISGRNRTPVAAVPAPRR